MIIDTHAHYDDESFDEDRDALIRGMRDHGVSKVLNAGASLSSAYEGLRLSEKYPEVYCALGVHPNEIAELTEADMDRIAADAALPKVAAIGEIGLEYHYEEPGRELQKRWFRRQIALARAVKLPIIVHSRDAAQDTLDILREERAEEAGGVIHCFSYSAEVAKICVSMGFYIGIGGVVTFKNGRKMKETVETVPMERILLETDSPYLAPVPYRGKRNCSWYLRYVAEEIGKLRGISTEEVIRITEENAYRAFPKLGN